MTSTRTTAPIADWAYIETLTGDALESALAGLTGIRCEPDKFGHLTAERHVHYVSPDDLHTLAGAAPTAAPLTMCDAVADALAAVRANCPDVTTALVLSAAMGPRDVDPSEYAGPWADRHARRSAAWHVPATGTHAPAVPDVVSESGRIVATRLARALTGAADADVVADVRQALTLALAPVVSALADLLDADDAPAVVRPVARVVAHPAHTAHAVVRVQVGTRDVPWSQCERDATGAPVQGGAVWSGTASVPVFRTVQVTRRVHVRPATVSGTRRAIVSTGGARQRDGLTTCTRAGARTLRRAWLTRTNVRRPGRVTPVLLDSNGYPYDLGYSPVALTLGPVPCPPAARPAPLASPAYVVAATGTTYVRDMTSGQGRHADGARDALRRVPLAAGQTITRERLASPIVGGSWVQGPSRPAVIRRPRKVTRDDTAALAATAALASLRSRLVR